MVPPAFVSRVASVHQLGGVALVPLGMGLSGVVADATSPSAVLVVAGCLGLVATAVVLAVPDVWRLRAASDVTNSHLSV
jgi:hypothetical protein